MLYLIFEASDAWGEARGMKTSCLRLRNREPEKPSEGGGAACAAPAESTSCLTDGYLRPHGSILSAHVL